MIDIPSFTNIQLLAHVGKEYLLAEVLSFIISSVSHKGSVQHSPPTVSKSPKENVLLYCQQLASASKGLQLNELGVENGSILK